MVVVRFMKVRHSGKQTELVETNLAHKLGLPVAVIFAARRKLNFLKGAVSERDIRVMKSLHFEKLQGKRDGQYSIRLNDQWRLVFEFSAECNPPEIVILAIEDYH